MKLRVLGCHGGELPGCRSTCFLVDDRLAIDAGALTSTLSLKALSKVDTVLLTHSHFDHVKDLPLMVDTVAGMRKTPITVYSSKECITALEKNMFNDVLWPNFTKIPSKKHPLIRFKTFEAGSSFKMGDYSVDSVRVRHPVPSVGFVIKRGSVAIGVSGDTGPTETLWKLFSKTKNLKAIFVETSFPNAQQSLADVSGHLTPNTLKSELKKLKGVNPQVFLYHLKPAYIEILKRQVAQMNVHVLELNETFDIS